MHIICGLCLTYLVAGQPEALLTSTSTSTSAPTSAPNRTLIKPSLIPSINHFHLHRHFHLHLHLHLHRHLHLHLCLHSHPHLHFDLTFTCIVNFICICTFTSTFACFLTLAFTITSFLLTGTHTTPCDGSAAHVLSRQAVLVSRMTPTTVVPGHLNGFAQDDTAQLLLLSALLGHAVNRPEQVAVQCSSGRALTQSIIIQSVNQARSPS